MITSKSTLRKCKGCGTKLSIDKQSLGYVPKLDKDTKLCYRCFQLKHYHRNITNEVVNEQVINNVNALDVSNKNVFMIIDVLDLYNLKLIDLTKAKNVFLIINKMDLFKYVRNIDKLHQAIIKNLEILNLKYNEVFFTSIKSLSSIKRLDYFLNKLNQNNKNIKSIFIGKTNAGKSSIINALLKLNHQEANLSTNNQLNTTINLQKVKIGKYEIIDTPGICDKNNILNYINANDLDKLNFNQKNVSVKNYQIKYNKRLMIENLIIIDVYLDESLLEDEVGSISFYLNKNLKIISKQIKPALFNQQHLIQYNTKDWSVNEQEFKLDKKANLSIDGLGLISLKNIKQIKLYLRQDVNISLWKFAII